MPSRTPTNGLEMANQKEKSQPGSWAIAFVFTLFSQAFEDRHLTKHELSFWDAGSAVGAIRIDAWV